MGLLDLASGASAWRGYEYYQEKKITSVNKQSETEYTGKVLGSQKQPYDVKIDIDHPRKSACNCPHANGKRIICKHQIALYFTIFPGEAERYYREVVEYEEEEERRQDALDEKVIEYINSLSKDELRQTLYEVLYDGADWVFERFVREHIEL